MDSSLVSLARLYSWSFEHKKPSADKKKESSTNFTLAVLKLGAGGTPKFFENFWNRRYDATFGPSTERI